MRDLREERGFTLLEIIVAVIIASVIGTLLMVSFTSSKMMPASISHETASVVAQQKLEPLSLAVRWDTWETAGAALDPNTTHSLGKQYANGHWNTASYTVNTGAGAFDYDGDGKEDFRRVDMTVDIA